MQLGSTGLLYFWIICPIANIVTGHSFEKMLHRVWTNRLIYHVDASRVILIHLMSRIPLFLLSVPTTNPEPVENFP